MRQKVKIEAIRKKRETDSPKKLKKANKMYKNRNLDTLIQQKKIKDFEKR